MVSANKANFNLRETLPLSHNWDKGLSLMGQRTNPNGHRDWLFIITSPKDEARHLSYLASVRDSAKSGLGCVDNRHLTYLAEFIFVNVGDSQQDVKASSPLIFVVRVGGVIVLRAWENYAHGEGRQPIRSLKLSKRCSLKWEQYRRQARNTSPTSEFD
jgi:hypothetical protein